MRDGLHTIRTVKQNSPRLGGARGVLRSGWSACIGLAGLLITFGFAAAQDMTAPLIDDSAGWDSGGPPMTSMGEGSYFSQDLGTTVRARFNTRSYGQDEREEGNLDIGTMQVISWEDAIAFIDGQVTLSDVQGVGFNVGVGYRWISYVPYATDAERVTGVSLWADGTSTEGNNFFPQLGVSFESLGDIWDLRANGYIPIGQDSQVGPFVPTGVIGFQGNFISELAIATVDQSFYAAEVELARRLGRERDAWAFAGAYELANDIQDTAGGRVGVRGYAYPDLLLQVAVTHDEIFATNTTFSATWFIGRTRTNFHPACGVRDRFREPVMRNDYVVLSQSTANGGTPLTDVDGNPFRVVHVDSNAPAGGTGTFESPLNNLNDIDDNSQTGDIVFAHANSTFNGQSATLQAQQRFLGEGDGIKHTIVTSEEGPILIPESSPGASDAPRPMILAALGNAVTIGDRNEVANFTIDGGTTAIAAGAFGSGNPNLHDLTIRNTTSDAIILRPFVRTDSEDSDNDGNLTEQFVEFSVNIQDVTFENIGGDDINMDAFTAVDVTAPNVTLQEAITIGDIVSTNGGGRGIRLANTHSAGTFALTNYTNTGATVGPTEGRLYFENPSGDQTLTNVDITGGTGYALAYLNVDDDSSITVTQLDYDGGSAAAGAIRFNIFDGQFVISNSTLEGGTLDGVALLNQNNGTVTFQSSVTATNLGNQAGAASFLIDGGVANAYVGVFAMSGPITSSLGRSVLVRGMGDAGTSVVFNGNIIDTGQGILVDDNLDGDILFGGNIQLTTMANTAITISNNTSNVGIDFAGDVDIVTTSGNGFDATGGGTITVSNTNNSIATTNGQIARITGMAISNAGVNFADVSRTTGAATNAIQLENNTGGPITFGTVTDNVGDAGTIAGGAADVILVRNSADVAINGVRINTVATFSGILVDKTNNNAMTVDISDVETNGGDIGLEINGNATTGALTMSINDTTVNNATDFGIRFNDVDTSTVSVNNGFVNGGGATAGIQILNSNGTFNFDAATRTQGVTGTDFDVNGGTPIVNMAGDLTNTTGRSVEIQNVTGGSITFSAASSINDDGEGLRIHDNSGGTFSFLGDNDFDPIVNTDAIVLTNNTGASITFAGLNINTTGAGNTATGRGLVATGGGTLSVTGTTNIIETDNGTGLQIEDMTVGSVDLQRVTVDGTTGPTNAILLRNLTGGQVAIGSATGAANSGGIVRATDDAIVLENVQNVDLRSMQVAANGAANAGIKIEHSAAATTSMDITINGLNLTSTAGTGIDVDGTNDANAFNVRFTNSTSSNFVWANNVDIDISGAGAFGLLVDNIDINSSGTPADTAFALDFSGNAQTGNVTFRNTVGANKNDFTAGTGSALSITASGATAKTINLLVEEGNFNNSDGTNPAANFLSSGNTLLNATIEANSFSNSDAAGSDFTMTATGATARIRLKLGDADPANFNTAASNGEFNLIEDLGADFDVFEKAQTFPPTNARNTGVVVPTPNDAAFDDSPVAPPLPTVP